jgi:hypothetical protein
MAQNRIFARLMRHICFLLLLALRMDGASFFVQLSDPQFGMYANDANFVQETANFEFVVANVNRLRPAFVVVCGDLVNKPGDAAQIAEYRRIAGKLDQSIPLYNVAGNHDVGNEPTPASLAAYRHTFGPDYYTFQSGDLFGFVLDSSLIQHPEKAPEEAAHRRPGPSIERRRDERSVEQKPRDEEEHRDADIEVREVRREMAGVHLPGVERHVMEHDADRRDRAQAVEARKLRGGITHTGRTGNERNGGGHRSFNLRIGCSTKK